MTLRDASRIMFHEEQRFTQLWIRLLLGGLVALMVGLYGWGLVEQLVHGRPWGNNPISDTGLVLSALAQAAVLGGIIWLFRAMRLVTEVRSDGLHVRFRPFVRKHYPFAAIRRCEARTYRPIAEELEAAIVSQCRREEPRL